MFEIITMLVLTQPVFAGSSVFNGQLRVTYVTEVSMTLKHGPFATEDSCKSYLNSIPDKVVQNSIVLDVKSKVCSAVPEQPKAVPAKPDIAS